MTNLSQWLLTGVGNYGAPLLALFVYLGSLGIPFPVTLLLIAVGAFIRQGVMVWWLAGLVTLAAAILADTTLFTIGYRAQSWVQRKFGQKEAWQKAEEFFERRGGLAIIFTRFWLTPLAPAVDLIAATRYSYARFLAFDFVGEIVWVVLFGGVGYIFETEWEAAYQLISDFSGLSMGLVILGVGIFWLLRRRKK